MDRRLLLGVLVVCLTAALAVPAAASGANAAERDAMHSAAGGVGGFGGVGATVDTVRLGASSGSLGRTDTEGVLEQPTRAAVFEAIESSPGASLSAIATAVGVAKSTVKYHVGVLRDAGLVDGATVAGTDRFAPADVDAELAGVLGADATAAVLRAVAANEPAATATVAAATDRAVSTASHHLSRLEERGVIERERAGEAVVATLAPATRRALTDDAAAADD
jgi:DNA-binding transcriptional ArsR family regulator